MKTQCAKLKKVIEQILAKRGLLLQFNSSVTFHLKIENSPFMPLVIEKYGDRVTVAHYFEQNGDQIADPDFEMLIGADGELYPIAIQHSNGHYVRAREWRDGKEYINSKQLVEQVKFSNMWAQNIKNQGFIAAGL